MSNKLNTLLQWYADNGCEYLFQEETTNLLSDRQQKVISSSSGVKANSIENKEQTLVDQCNTLAELREIIKNFEGCDLKKSAHNTVIGDGKETAEVMLIGEAPGANEDKEGIPFCGQSGKLLNNILKSIGLNREEVYITNTVFWRPPGNRRPTGEELQICRPFVEKHISLINPKLIILVGSTAVESLLGLQHNMGELRKKAFRYNNKYLKKNIDTAVIYHPSYLLRQPYKKKEMWEDIQYIKNNFLKK